MNIEEILESEVKNILVIRFKGLGDIMLSVPAIKAIKAAYPNANVSVLVDREAEPVLSGFTFINEIILFNRNKHGGLFGSLKMISEIRKKKFDLVLDLYGNPRSAIITRLSGAKYRAGTTHRVRQRAYNIKIEGPKEILYGARVHLLAAAACGADIYGANTDLEIYIPHETAESIDNYFFKYGIKDKEAIAVNPFANWETKTWGEKKFAELADRLIDSGKKVIIIWGPGEDKDSFVKLMKNKPLVAPGTNIKQLAYLLKHMKAVITNDTVVKHLAVAVKVPTVTVYGATNPKAWEPEKSPFHRYVSANLDCQPCEKTYCDKFVCMENVSVDNVLSELKSII